VRINAQAARAPDGRIIEASRGIFNTWFASPVAAMPKSAADPRVRRILAMMMPLGPVEARRMFGGYGFYLGGTIFGLLFDGELFLKADAETKGDFERRGLGPLTYEGGKGQEIALPYWQAPKSLLKDGPALCRWAKKAYGAGLRADARKKKKPARAATASAGSEESADAETSMPSTRARRPRYEPDF
jgi:DNA transformation protein